MHPYPRKLSENGTDNTTSCQQPASAPQPSAPSQAQLLSYPMLDTRGGEPSLGQVLEAAAMAAANAWSQVVASAGSKVQQQLQVPSLPRIASHCCHLVSKALCSFTHVAVAEHHLFYRLMSLHNKARKACCHS